MAKLFWWSFFTISPCLLLAQTNEGTEFWFSFMEHFDEGAETRVVMITAEENTSGTIRLPFHNWQETFTVMAGQVTFVQLPREAETFGSESIQNNGVHLTTQKPVAVYIHQYQSLRSEATIVLPVSALGNAYYAVTYKSYQQDRDIYPSEFLVIATEDQTQVTITPSDDTRQRRSPNASFSVTLNAGETYQVQARGSDDDLTGSFITANKKVNVFAGNKWAQVPLGCNFRDNLLEQMYPVATWGKQFMTVPNADASFDVYRIVASKNNTTVEIRGTNPQTFTLNAGAFFEFTNIGPMYIIASDPIAIAQFNIGSGCNSGNSQTGDPAMVMLNSVEQIREKVTLYNSPFENITEHYINLIFQTIDIDNLTVDGQTLAARGATIITPSFNDKFSYTQLRVSAGTHTIESDGCGVIATAYGYGFAESYAYAGGAKFEPINIADNFIPDGGCLNDTIAFSVPLEEPRHTLRWDLGDGTTQTGPSFTHIYDKLGTYTVTLYLRDNCLEISDTLVKDILISLRQAVDIPMDVQVCEDADFTLGATDIANATYEWSGPNGFFSTEQFPTKTEAKLPDAGTYSVIGIVSGCATFPAMLEVEVTPKPQPNLGRDTLVCTRLPDFNLVLDPGNFAQYRWQDGSFSSTYNINTPGTYEVLVTDVNGCKAMDSIILTEVCPTRFYVPNAFSPNRDGVNDTFGVFGSDIEAITFQVFDRWGNLLFETDRLDEPWDGRFKDEPMGVGVYLWVAKIAGVRSNNEPFTTIESGTVTLIR